MCEPVVLQGLRALFPSNAPQRAGFWRIETPAKRTRKGILRVEILVPENIPRNNPVQENIPRNIPCADVQKTLHFQGLARNIPNIPNIPGMPGMRCLMRAKRYLHAWTFVPSNAPQRAFFGLRFVCQIRPHPRINPRVTRKSTKYPRIRDSANPHDCLVS